MAKKKNNNEQVTPEQLSKFNDDTTTASEIKHLHARADSADITRYKKHKKTLSIILGVAIAILLLLFAISTLVTQWGDLIISVSSPAVKKGIVLSEDPDFKTMSASLSSTQVENVTNITYNWLPKDLDTSGNGSHNGKNYVAYTFYCKNNGQVSLDYKATLEITGVAKSADEAARIMVYKNGEETVYAKGKYDDRSKPEEDAVKFESDTIVMTTQTNDFVVDQVDKYTIVMWIEGNDPECIDDIRNGHIRMRMLFDVLDDEQLV